MKPPPISLEQCPVCIFSPRKNALAVVEWVRGEIIGALADEKIEAAIGAVFDQVVAELSGCDRPAPAAAPTPAAMRQRRYRERRKARYA